MLFQFLYQAQKKHPVILKKNTGCYQIMYTVLKVYRTLNIDYIKKQEEQDLANCYKNNSLICNFFFFFYINHVC